MIRGAFGRTGASPTPRFTASARRDDEAIQVAVQRAAGEEASVPPPRLRSGLMGMKRLAADLQAERRRRSAAPWLQHRFSDGCDEDEERDGGKQLAHETAARSGRRLERQGRVSGV